MTRRMSVTSQIPSPTLRTSALSGGAHHKGARPPGSPGPGARSHPVFSLLRARPPRLHRQRLCHGLLVPGPPRGRSLQTDGPQRLLLRRTRLQPPRPRQAAPQGGRPPARPCPPQPRHRPAGDGKTMGGHAPPDLTPTPRSPRPGWIRGTPRPSLSSQACGLAV